jgi:hypothetical protein
VAVLEGAIPGFDPNDIFGLRRALELLPETEWDRFIARWSEIGECCDYDLVSIRADVEDEAEALRDRDSAHGRAWAVVSVAMRAYFVWRAATRPGAEPGTQ